MNKCKICGQEWLVQHHCTKLAEHTPNQATDSTKPAEREELLPCPFCGEPSDLTVHVYGNGDDDAYVQCRECTTCGPDGGDRAGAIAKWNHRALLAADGKAQEPGA